MSPLALVILPHTRRKSSQVVGRLKGDYPIVGCASLTFGEEVRVEPWTGQAAGILRLGSWCHCSQPPPSSLVVLARLRHVLCDHWALGAISKDWNWRWQCEYKKNSVGTCETRSQSATCSPYVYLRSKGPFAGSCPPSHPRRSRLPCIILLTMFEFANERANTLPRCTATSTVATSPRRTASSHENRQANPPRGCKPPGTNAPLGPLAPLAPRITAIFWASPLWLMHVHAVRKATEQRLDSAHASRASLKILPSLKIYRVPICAKPHFPL